MTPTPSATAEQSANIALAHFFIGLMKADGHVSQAEEKKVEILLHKFRHGLPGAVDEVILRTQQMTHAPQFADWEAEQHLTTGFTSFDHFVDSGQAVPDHMRTIIEMLEILVEVDGVTDTEIVYLDKMKEGFLNKYKVAV